jgi:hypothetical protein
MSLNCAILGAGWLTLFVALSGEDRGFRQIVRRRRLVLACILGALAPVPPFVHPHTYTPNIMF